jgi:2-polyprenyl-6-methoxyphenol hydroxylase-like FAD-dependent oxidoreductase
VAKGKITNTSVLIVGGSLNGLTEALLLAQRGIKCLVVERQPTTSVQYKFRGISPRSMEIYRGLGIDEEIRANRTGDQKAGRIARMKNLSDPEINWQGLPWADTGDLSPATAETCDQDRLEPILRKHAEERGAQIHFNTELVSFEQDDQGITARIVDHGTEQEETVQASYLIAADGGGGKSREALGIERHGPGVLQHWMNVIFDTDLNPVLEGRPITSVFLTDINGTFVPRDEGRWLMAVQYVPEQGQRAEDFTAEYCRELIFRGAGRSDLKTEIVDARSWTVAAYVADRFAEGRAFLIGDAAHLMPPTGGFGGNTGIHDAHNLAWKLDAVLREAAGPSLLDTYDSERRWIAERTLAQALARLQAWFKDPSKKLPPAEKIIDDYYVIFGQLYRSGAFIAEEDSTANEGFEDPRKPSGRPGSRAAHVIVERAGERLSTIDLFKGRWVLLVGSSGDTWLRAAHRTPAATNFNLQHFSVGSDGDVRDINNRWSSAYGVNVDGAVLVRPDGFIAWRAREASDEPEKVLRDVFERLSFREKTETNTSKRARPQLSSLSTGGK